MERRRRGGCNDNSEESCTVFDYSYSYKYTVLPAKQYVKECPNFSSYNLEDKGSKECKRKKLWKYNTDNPSHLKCVYHR